MKKWRCAHDATNADARSNRRLSKPVVRHDAQPNARSRLYAALISEDG